MQGNRIGGAGGIIHPSKLPLHVKGPQGTLIHTANYAGTHGAKTKGGTVVYKGQVHQHWTHRHYSAAWRCWCWYDPCTCGWYYWSGAKGYYLPVQYLVTIAPSQTELDAGADELPPDGGNVTVAEGTEIPDLPEIP